jgi:hypothetical protein
MSEPNLHELRLQLDRLARGDEPLESLQAQVTAIEQIKEVYPHSISLVAIGVPGMATNCFMQALRLAPGDIRGWALGRIFPGSDFMAAIVKYLPELDLMTMPDGALVLYFGSDGRPVHAGVAEAGRVLSKWGGMIPHTFLHGVYEVPARYGSDVRAYVRPAPENVLNAYRQWAEMHGVSPN